MRELVLISCDDINRITVLRHGPSVSELVRGNKNSDLALKIHISRHQLDLQCKQIVRITTRL